MTLLQVRSTSIRAGIVRAGIAGSLAFGLLGSMQPASVAAVDSTPGCAAERTAARANPTSVDGWKTAGYCEVDRRQVTITTLTSNVNGASTLTSADRSALLAILSADKSGLSSLRSQIAADTTVAAVRADDQKVFEDFRIYALVARQVHLVRGADLELAAVARFGTVAEKLQARIDAAAQGGKDVTAAKAALASMQAAVSKAQGLASPVSGKILPLTPAGFNAGSAKPVLDQARADLAAARTQLIAARAAARQVLAALK